MKVTRLKNGYRIRLNDTEFAVLEFLADSAVEGILGSSAGWDTPDAKDEDGIAHWAPKERRAYGRRLNGGSFLKIDEDRR